MKASTKIARFWDGAWTDRFERMSTTWPSVAFGTLGIDLSNVRLVLDVGCGENCLSSSMNRDGINRHVVGIDISDVALTLAKQQNRPGETKFTFVQGDATKLPFESNSFDMVTAFDVITLMGPAYIRALKEMWRVTKEYLIFNVSHRELGPTEAIGGLRPISLDENKINEMLLRLSPRHMQTCTFTLDDFVYWNTPVREHSYLRDGDKKLAILALARK